MKKVNKSLWIILALVLVMLCSACTSGSTPPAEPSGSAERGEIENTSSTEKDIPRVAMVMGQMNMDFFVYIAAGAEKAADEMGIDLTVWNASSDLVKVGELVDLAVDQGFDAIITPDTSGSAKAAIENANSRNIPVIGYDSLAFPELFVATIASDSIEMGKQCANQAIEVAKAEGKDSYTFVISYNPTAQSCILRHDGMIQALEASGLNYKVEEVGTTVNDVSDYLSLWDDLLSRYKEGEIDFALGADSFNSIGCISACEAAERYDIKVFGIDDEADQLNGLKKAQSERIYWATIAQQPVVIGELCVEAAIAALNGEKMGALYADATVVTPDNVEQFINDRTETITSVQPYIEAWDFEMN